MAITGQVKFFYKNRADKNNTNCSVAVSTGTGTRNNIRDRTNNTKWISSGSNDATTETITIDFGATYSLNRILLALNNFKAFTVKYWTGSAWTEFSSVVTKEGTQTNITETNNSKESNYYEFATVSTDKIQITITTTKTTNAEKEVYQVIATSEIGIFSGYPNIQRNFDRGSVAKKTSINGFSKFSILFEQFSARLTFASYPTEADHTLIQLLWDSKQEFLIYPCGGNEAQFRYQNLKGNRLEDIYLVWFDSAWNPNYSENVYSLALNYDVSIIEVA